MTLPPPQAVVLVHGLWVSGWAMRRLARHLRGCGFRTYLFSYPSLSRRLLENAAALRRFADGIDADVVHFVGHSLGGVVIQAMLALCPPARAGRVVTLSSPHAGSRVAREVARRRWGSRVLGASIADLLKVDPAHVPPAPREVGLIKGSRPIGLGRLFVRFEGANDGVVALEEMRWAGAADEIVLRASHTEILFSRRAAAAACQFLRFGHFVR